MDWDNAKEFSFEGQTKDAKVMSVYDGDTIKVSFPLAGTYYIWNCRLTGVDTPELRTKNAKEKEHGYLVRDELRKRVLGKFVTVECGEFDKYGRLLIKILLDGEDINKWLIDTGYAFAYDGGTKQEWFP